MRGNPNHSANNPLPPRSIPASAGQPSARGRPNGMPPVYPRECGATYCNTARAMSFAGLSPRVRGNLEHNLWDRRGHGSIPASAGQPHTENHKPQRNTVYPRECGATRKATNVGKLWRGLSPRVRGNHQHAVAQMVCHRSIPASAGQPIATRRGRCPLPVYPRECGATWNTIYGTGVGTGLSPRVRGNLTQKTINPNETRSIPASAGQPGRRPTSGSCGGVYPRECGATLGPVLHVVVERGLSPRVRGNRLGQLLQVRRARSIPASAGQPAIRRQSLDLSPVYPRECGATNRRGLGGSGLSPRVRGNHQHAVAQMVCHRSIPASAGQPR